MCEGIARTGNGICLFALESDNILRKTAKLVRASRTFIIKNISIDWGLPNPQDSTDPNLRIIQAPDNIVSIYPGVRFLVTALIHDESYSIPQEVILRGQRDGKGEMIEVKVPVCQIELSSDDSSVPFIHTLSARRLITQLEDQQYRSDCSAEWRQALITRFGEEYQLASRHTSFVAVGDIEPSDAEPFDNTNLLGEEDEEDGEDSDDEMGCLLVDDDYYYPPPTLAVSPPIIQPPLSIGRQYTPASPSHTPASPSSAQASPAYSPASLSYAPTPPLARNLPAELTTPDPLDCIPSVEEKARTTVSAPSVDDLIRLQSFNGSFSLSNKFREIFGKTTCDEGKRRGVGKATWATILAIAYLQRHLADQPDLLEELVEKAKDFVRISQSEADMQALVEIAKTLVH